MAEPEPAARPEEAEGVLAPASDVRDETLAVASVCESGEATGASETLVASPCCAPKTTTESVDTVAGELGEHVASASRTAEGGPALHFCF